MTSVSFDRDGWLEDVLDSEGEAETFTRLRVSVGKTVLTRNYSKRGGGESAAINVPLLPLCNFIAQNWWPLLYEPIRRTDDEYFQARHRLDTPMHGYVFPAVAICSAGDEALLIDWQLKEDRFSPVDFLSSPPTEPIQLARAELEPGLMDLVEASLERLRSDEADAIRLRDNWRRVQDSLSNQAEREYCVAVGRLGLDPYDPDSPDMSGFMSELQSTLFNDLSDAADVGEIGPLTGWTKDAIARVSSCPSIDVEAFGAPPADDLRAAPWMVGGGAARSLIRKLGLIDRPKQAVNELLGAAVNRSSNLSRSGPAPITSLVQRANGIAYIGAVAQSSRQQRFRACAAAYLAWVTYPGEERAGTVALTRRQQASRAFAAEMVAPRDYLREQAGPFGMTGEDIERQASRLICPFETVLWQAVRAGIPLRGIELPSYERPSLFPSRESTLPQLPQS